MKPMPTAAITAGQVMTTPAISVAPESSVAVVAELLTTRRISGVPVVDPAGAVLGLVSERDLLARTGCTAADVMTTAVISVSTDTDIEQVRQILVDQPIRRVPVLAAGRLAGMITRHDLVGRLVEWVCGVCGESVRGARQPAACSKCGGSGDRFHLQEQLPGA